MHNSSMTGVLCSAKLRSGDPCRSVATDAEFCAYHAALEREEHAARAYGTIVSRLEASAARAR